MSQDKEDGQAAQAVDSGVPLCWSFHPAPLLFMSFRNRTEQQGITAKS
ncbi:hypothetical protein GMO_01370 [Gluconobacter morbifer G707]|uniref:Uncharacterized protein n=1 Tax=Gluconobacter morbifer G707 TaxID=1088869 RepID=G6XF72_9PROT|nr:hypothetical protein GMO_01370 [Gluconobacter morbifer G707]